ncbi:unnamed protein product [Meganyctiphanes norvegica]|uniref:Uncharacterized protein n=1 Tax=Meganyctiphanes norvegica TaxID=48144 RepID=A0AAV2QTI3_MEGNR
MTTMDKYTVLWLICVVAGVQITSAIICYDCIDTPGISDHWTYDPNCAAYDYHGSNYTTDGNEVCYILYTDNGSVTRGRVNEGVHQEGDCRFEFGFVQCYCETDYCNTGSYCEQCVH